MRGDRKSRKTLKIGVAAFLSVAGPGVAYAQDDTCVTPQICGRDCGNDVWCQMLQYFYKCDRQVCSG